MQKDWQLYLHISCQHMLMPAALLCLTKKLGLNLDLSLILAGILQDNGFLPPLS